MSTDSKFLISRLLVLVLINDAIAQYAQYIQYPPSPLWLKTTEMFYFSFNDHIFKDRLFLNRTDIKYRVSLEKLPDLPDWISHTHEPGGDSFLYGTIPQEIFEMSIGEKLDRAREDQRGILIRVIATNKITYDIRSEAVMLKVEERESKAQFQVEMCFVNFNVEDMFRNNRLDELISIIKTHLWKIDDEIYTTMIENSVKMGGRVPPNPRDPVGVVVRIGSTANFSNVLIALDDEVSPLRVRVPCPKEYKRTSADMHFRSRNFEPDWCRFRLHYPSSAVQEKNGPVQSPIQLTSDNFDPPEFVEQHRDLVPEFILSVVAPIVTSILALIVVAFLVCCYHEGIEKRNKESPRCGSRSSIQMVQYASIHRASNNLRSLATKRDGAKSSATTPTSTIQRSYGNNTLNKHQNTLKSYEGKSVSNSTLPKDGSVPNYTGMEKSSL